MKKLFLVLVITAINYAAHAQVPKKISYQGLLTTSMGTPASTGSYTLQFELYDSLSGGSSVWTETDTGVAVQEGSFAVILGKLTPLTLAFNKIYYLQVTATAGPGISTPVTFSPRTELTSAPYALRADTAEYAKASPAGGGGPYLPLAGGTMSGAITNTGDPPITMGKGNFGSANLNTGAQAFVSGANNRARGAYSVVNGGGTTALDSNSATGDYSSIGGGRRNVATGTHNTVGGGQVNSATGTFQATVGGGGSNTASGNSATVSGGNSNTASGYRSIVAGGILNTASNQDATVGGGESNTASGFATVIGGGANNRARGSYAVVAAGGGPLPSDSNSAVGDYGTVSGGRRNLALADFSSIGGGSGNITSETSATIGGGEKIRLAACTLSSVVAVEPVLVIQIRPWGPIPLSAEALTMKQVHSCQQLEVVIQTLRV